MSSAPIITASYTVTSSSSEVGSSESTSTSGPLTFEVPVAPSADLSNDAQANKEQYLTALAGALSTLQDSINTGLTQRLVQQGVLSETTDVDPNVNTKLRTKVPGQPNNSKKGQTKKQQQREQKQKDQEENQQSGSKADSSSDSAGTETTASVTPALETVSLSSTNVTDTPMEVEPPTSTTQEDTEMQEDSKYRPKGGIYGDDEDEDAQEKDEVDLLMEADPGEVDGACLELPKDQQQPPQQEIHTKKRNELPADGDSASSLAAAKKSRGSGDE
ncbi:hypothetical protein BGZ80_004958 [Entomortierella chlamydospora]|uniref:EKC/KEOPS complex subunit GON7 n=1 Tax=Entomortierella chlamydospora TaxID=101097 RepID=A0A9P6MLH4_9FUNG|nr:hypothetical protein BGZ79_001740 [Entomortierella chlamydospora]KAG0007192.1 hypothetical protein BGZ80_004958 [Entomortierella chlamydospora]